MAAGNAYEKPKKSEKPNLNCLPNPGCVPPGMVLTPSGGIAPTGGIPRSVRSCWEPKSCGNPVVLWVKTNRAGPNLCVVEGCLNPAPPRDPPPWKEPSPPRNCPKDGTARIKHKPRSEERRVGKG